MKKNKIKSRNFLDLFGLIFGLILLTISLILFFYIGIYFLSLQNNQFDNIKTSGILLSFSESLVALVGGTSWLVPCYLVIIGYKLIKPYFIKYNIYYSQSVSLIGFFIAISAASVLFYLHLSFDYLPDGSGGGLIGLSISSIFLEIINNTVLLTYISVLFFLFALKLIYQGSYSKLFENLGILLFDFKYSNLINFLKYVLPDLLFYLFEKEKLFDKNNKSKKIINHQIIDNNNKNEEVFINNVEKTFDSTTINEKTRDFFGDFDKQKTEQNEINQPNKNSNNNINDFTEIINTEQLNKSLIEEKDKTIDNFIPSDHTVIDMVNKARDFENKLADKTKTNQSEFILEDFDEDIDNTNTSTHSIQLKVDSALELFDTPTLSGNDDNSFLVPSVKKLNKSSKNLIDENYINEIKNSLDKILNEFNIKSQVSTAIIGSSIYTFLLNSAPGIRANQIKNLESDIARMLKISHIRILKNVPGDSRIGIEINSPNRRDLTLGNIINNNEFINSKFHILLAMGRNTMNKNEILDLTAIPHMLIGGTTGSGKTSLIISIILGFLYKYTPIQLKLLLIDLKSVEFSPFKDIPHLISDPINNIESAAKSLEWAIQEMDARYNLFAQLGLRNITSYNSTIESILSDDENKYVKIQGNKIKISELEKLPYIVLVIDEFSDLILYQEKGLESSIVKLAEKSKAAGIHLIISTQCLINNIITSNIKTNFQVKCSFKTSNKNDSRTIIDQDGAEALMANGDMLLADSTKCVTRIQTPLINDKDIVDVVNLLKKNFMDKASNHFIIDFNNSNQDIMEAIYKKVKHFSEIYTGKLTVSYVKNKFNLPISSAIYIIEKLKQN